MGDASAAVMEQCGCLVPPALVLTMARWPPLAMARLPPLAMTRWPPLVTTRPMQSGPPLLESLVATANRDTHQQPAHKQHIHTQHASHSHSHTPTAEAVSSAEARGYKAGFKAGCERGRDDGLAEGIRGNGVPPARGSRSRPNPPTRPRIRPPAPRPCLPLAPLVPPSLPPSRWLGGGAYPRPGCVHARIAVSRRPPHQRALPDGHHARSVP